MQGSAAFDPQMSGRLTALPRPQQLRWLALFVQELTLLARSRYAQPDFERAARAMNERVHALAGHLAALAVPEEPFAAHLDGILQQLADLPPQVQDRVLGHLS